MAKKDVGPVLESLPVLSCETQAAPWATLEQRLDAATQQYVVSKVTSPDAVATACAIWRTAFFWIVVLMEAWSRTTGMPTVIYIDTFYALVSSLVNKNIDFDAAGFPCRARYWACGTAAPGSGKSPAMEPLKAAASSKAK